MLYKLTIAHNGTHADFVAGSVDHLTYMLPYFLAPVFEQVNYISDFERLTLAKGGTTYTLEAVHA